MKASWASSSYDATVVGAGPNGLAAAITLARAGRKVLLVEERATAGGAVTTAELTLPGFAHDTGAAVFPLGIASPFLRRLPLDRFGLRWIQPPIPVAHPLDGGGAAVVYRSLRRTARELGADATTYARLVGLPTRWWERALPTMLGPLLRPRFDPVALPALAELGLAALLPAAAIARLFRGQEAAAIVAGMAAHGVLPLSKPPTAAFGILFSASAHAAGWPIAEGGARRVAEALASYFVSLGGEIVTGVRIEQLHDLPSARTIMLDLSPKQALQLAGERIPAHRRRVLERFRRGPGIFKLDWALDEPIPWTAEACRRTATVHLGGTFAEVAAAEAAVARGEHPDWPFVLLAQPSLFDPGRAPAGKHTAWAYCHLPHGSTVDMTDRIEAQIERFAPGFRERILARSALGPAALERWNANLEGGDITAGIQDLAQFVARPLLSANPYRLAEGIYLCSASTPPGPGVHGMCGFHAASAAMRTGH